VELGRKEFDGELSLRTASGHHLVTFAGGRVVNAAAPSDADRFASVAVAMGLVTAEQAAAADRMRLRSTRDELGRLADAATLGSDQIAALRRETILRRAARILSLTRAEVKQSSTTTLSVTPYAVDVRAVIYHGAYAHLSSELLAPYLRERSQVERVDVAAYGFGPRERAMVTDLLGGATWSQIAASHPNASPRALRALAYALEVCGDLVPPASIAQGSGEVTPPDDLDVC
jgi:hypothetical protein